MRRLAPSIGLCIFTNGLAGSLIFRTNGKRKPLIFPAAAILIILSFLISRKIKGSYRLIVYSSMALVVWASVLYQFIHIAQYIDASGARISDILGSSGLALSWIGLIVTTLLMLLLLFEAIKVMRRGSHDNKSK